MPSPFQRHRDRVLAQMAKTGAPGALATDEPSSSPEAPIESKMRALLLATIRDLKNIKATQRKAEFKRERLLEFDDFVDGVIAAGGTDEVLCTLVTWNVDAGRYDRAIEIAAHLLKVDDESHPIGFNIPSSLVLVKLIAKEALKTDTEVTLEQLTDVQRLLDGYNVDSFDDIMASLHRAVGHHLEQAGQYDTACDNYQAALGLNDKVGVKAAITRLEKLKTTSPPA